MISIPNDKRELEHNTTSHGPSVANAYLRAFRVFYIVTNANYRRIIPPARAILNVDQNSATRCVSGFSQAILSFVIIAMSLIGGLQ